MTIKYIRYYLNLLLFIFISNTVLTQQNELSYKQLTTNDGLPDDITISIAQDEKGFMWFGTRSGLVSYDGVKIRTFSYDPDFPDGLNGNNIVGLYVDSNGVLWIGTINGLCRFDEKLDRPINIPIIINGQKISPEIRYITSSINNLIWIGTLDQGLISYDPLHNKYSQYLHSPNEQNSIASNRINSIVCTPDNKVWIGTGKGLNSFDQNHNIFELYKHDSANSNTISGDIITSLELGGNEELWIGTLNSGLNRMNLISGDIQVYMNDVENKTIIAGNEISSIMFADSVVWFGAGRGLESLHRLDPRNGLITKFKIDVGLNAAGSIRALFKDKTGIIWFAKGLSGVKYFDPFSKNYDHYIIDIKSEDDLTNRVYGLNPISDSRIWASTFGGLVLFDFDQGILKNISEKNKFWLLNSNSIGVNNELWIPSRNYGIVRYNLNSNKISYLMHDQNSNGSISSDYVNIILMDSQGIIWVGSRDGGLDRINPNTGAVKRYNNIAGNTESIPDNNIYALLEENEEQLWVGSNSGLALFNKKTETFKKYSYDPNDSSSISSDQISYILKGKNGSLWVSTYGGGLNRFDSQKQVFKRYTLQKSNIPDNTVYSTLEDEDENIWVSTAAGIARFSPESETYDYLIAKPDYYKPAKFPNGNFGFSGPHGIIVFDPNRISFNSQPPIVSLNKMFINGEDYRDFVVGPLQNADNAISEIQMDHDQNDFRFEFMVAHFSNSNKNECLVYLEGYDTDWRSLGSARNINYTNLDPGEYQLKVKAASAYGVWTEEPLIYSIIIKPPLWKTWWAYTSYVLLTFLFFYSLRKYELNRRIEKENKKLLELENKRKSEELEEARQLQLSMLPKELPELPNLDIAVYMKTATEVGGDYYDFHVGLDGTLTAVVGDATGHGMRAGTMVTSTKSLFSSYADSESIVDTFHEMTRCYKNMHLDNLSMCMSMIKINGSSLRMSSAGMPPIYIYKKSISAVEEYLFEGMPLGTMNNFPYEVRESTINSGDTILMMSDGFPELMNDEKEMIGYKRVKQLFEEVVEKSPEEIIEKFKDTGSKWINDKDPDDDVTFVVIKVK